MGSILLITKIQKVMPLQQTRCLYALLNYINIILELLVGVLGTAILAKVSQFWGAPDYCWLFLCSLVGWHAIHDL